MKPVAGVGLFVLVLFLWRMTFAYSCLAWLFPVIVFYAIFVAQYEYILHRRKFRARYFFKPESWIHQFLLRKSWAMVLSALITLPVTFALIAFAATGSVTDWIFLIADAVLIVALYGTISRRVANHAAIGLSEIVTKLLTVTLSFWVMLVPYVFISYQVIDVPAYVDAASIERTLDAASSEIASLCAVTNWSLKLAQEVQAAAWFGSVNASSMVGGSYLGLLVWLLFFLNAALVFLAMGRGCVEMAAIVNRWGHSR